MRSVLIFLVLIALVVCQPPFAGGNRERRENRRKEFQKDMVDCLLKSDISAELKKEIQDNKDDDLRKVLHTFMTKLDSNDREVIRKCRRELFTKMRDNMGRFIDRPNITDFHRFKEKLTEKKNAN